MLEVAPVKGRGVLLFLIATLASTSAFARPFARLAVERASGAAACPSEDELRRGIIERLGYDALRADAAAEIDVRFQAEDAGGFWARVSQRDARGLPAGERTLTDEGPDCAALGDAVILTISVLLESTSVPPRSAPSTLPSPSPSRESTGESTPPVERDAIGPRFRAEATADLGVAPAPAAGLSLAAGVRGGPLSLDLEGHADAPAEGEFPGGRVRTSVRMLELVPCRHHVAYVWSALGRLGIAHADRDDALQEVFLHVHDLLADYDASRPFKPWLFAIAYRVALQHHRKRGRRREQLEPPSDVAAKAGTHDDQRATEAREIVARALASIDIHRRAVFLMKELDGHDVPEIADALGIPLNTAYSRLRVAREEFRDAVARIEGGVP